MTTQQSYQQQVFSFISSVIGQSNSIPTPVEFIRFLDGDANTAIILTQIIYWQGKGNDPDGWIYKSYTEWEEETGLTKRKASRAVDVLKKMSIIETKVKKVNNNTILHYLFHHDVFIDLFGRHLEAKTQKNQPKPPPIMGSNETSFPEITKRDFQKVQNGISLPINTETTFKDYDDVKADPSISIFSSPESETQTSSSSFSQEDFSLLLQAVPDERKSSQVSKRLEKALKAGYDVEYLLDAVAYSHKNADEKFLGYLGNVIDKNYAPDGCYMEAEKERRRREGVALKKKQKVLSAQRDAQEKEKEQARLKAEAKKTDDLLESVDLDALDAFINQQDLTPYELQRFRQGKRDSLRRRYVVVFCKEKGVYHVK